MGAMIPLAELTPKRRPARPEDAPRLHAVYLASPGYFRLLGSEPPALADVARELEAAARDPRRRLELLYLNRRAVGVLDYKLDHPGPGEAAISLVLVAEPYRGRGIGRRAVAALEAELKPRARRLYAVVYGQNPGAERFFQALGYRYWKNGGPALRWYAKALSEG